MQYVERPPVNSQPPPVLRLRSGSGAALITATVLARDYPSAMLVPIGLCGVAAAVLAMYVPGTRIAGPRFAAPAPTHGCALPNVAGADCILAIQTSEAS
jgi:hypothetical protein